MIRSWPADQVPEVPAPFGDEHRETATDKSDLGLLLLDRGEIAEAERLFRENLATTERLLGAGHPNAAASKNFVGMVLAVRGDLAEAGKLQREALQARVRIAAELLMKAADRAFKPIPGRQLRDRDQNRERLRQLTTKVW